MTKLWLNFIQKILSIFISWPVAVVIISLKFEGSIVQLVDRMNKLKIGVNEVNFSEKLQEVEKNLDAEDIFGGEEDNENESVSEEYVELASIEPQMAIIRSWIDYEKLLRDKFNQLVEGGKLDYYPKRFISTSEMMLQLSKNGLINKNMYSFFKELNFLRNSIVHGQEVDVSTEIALEYDRILGKLKKIIEEI